MFQFSLDLIEQNVVKSGNVVPLKYCVETLIKYNKDLLEQEKLNEDYLRYIKEYQEDLKYFISHEKASSL